MITVWKCGHGCCRGWSVDSLRTIRAVRISQRDTSCFEGCVDIELVDVVETIQEADVLLHIVKRQYHADTLLNSPDRLRIWLPAGANEHTLSEMVEWCRQYPERVLVCHDTGDRISSFKFCEVE